MNFETMKEFNEYLPNCHKKVLINTIHYFLGYMVGLGVTDKTILQAINVGLKLPNMNEFTINWMKEHPEDDIY